MNVLGFLITLANLQNFSGNGGPLKDLSININRLQNLADNIKNHNEFPLESFRQNGYSRVGDIGIYLSKNLRDFILDERNDPQDEGLILTLYYDAKTQAPADVFDDKSNSLYKLILNKDVKDVNDLLSKLEQNDEREETP